MESCKKIDIDCITKIFIDKNPPISFFSLYDYMLNHHLFWKKFLY